MLNASDVRGSVDFGILTIRPDEYTAVLDRLRGHETVLGRSYYEFARIDLDVGGQCGVAAARCPEQGQGPAQSTAHNMLEDLDPAWILLVGIAGGVPDDDYSLGDVLLANRIYDFSVSAEIMEKEEHAREWNLMGGPVHPIVAAILAAIPGWKAKFKGWNSKPSIGMTKPDCVVPKELESPNLYGLPEHREKVQKSLTRHFPGGKKPRPPLYAVASVASANILAKDTALIDEWKRIARSFGFVEMEAGGVYRAAHRTSGECPVMVIRGLSDIVGFKRYAGWTEYARRTAASFAVRFIKSGVWATIRPPRGVPTDPDKKAEENEVSSQRGALDADSLAEQMARLTFAELEMVMKVVLAKPAMTGTDFKLLAPEEKLRRNDLTDRTRDQLVQGLSKVQLVGQYVEYQVKIDGMFPDRLKAGFLTQYRRLQGDGLAGDDLFDALADFASRGEPDRRYQAAGVAVLTYLFELCDVFEK